MTGNDVNVVWPMDVKESDFSSGPLVFKPRGFLVAILADPEEAEKAVRALRKGGFGERELRVYTGQQTLQDHQRYAALQNAAHRIVRAATNDPETLDLYFGHARDGRLALWVHVADDEAADRAIRYLADCRTLHIRHYGHQKQSDFYLERPTT
jgi:hypothetical protein